MGSCIALKLSVLQIERMRQENRNALLKMTSSNQRRRSNPHKQRPQPSLLQAAKQRQQHLCAHSVPRASSPQASIAQETARRCGNYHPSIWSHSLITESMGSAYLDTRFQVRLEELKMEAKLLLESRQEPLVLLRTIDSMQRLGVANLFQKEIKEALERYHESCCVSAGSCEEVALGFRLLRQYGYPVSSETMLRSYKDLPREPEDLSCQDVRSLLEIYEATHLATCEEPDVEEAKKTTARLLRMLLEQKESKLAKRVEHSLEMPLHWTMPRLEARRYINLYEMDEGCSPLLLELAKLDFNIVQSVHQRELKELSRWWTGLGLAEKLTFSRDRLVENYLWAVGIAFEPHFSDCRLYLTKLVCILTVIDDIYDVYGSLDELELFTAAVGSWKPEAVEILPEYMKPCFLAMYNFVDEVAFNVSEVHGWDVTPFLSKEWKRLCKGYLVEAQWFNKGYKPTLTKYLENAWITVGGPVAMVHVYFLQGCRIPHTLANCLDWDRGRKLIFLSSLIVRISDDLGTSKAEMERGDVPKSIQCFMDETCESEENSREYIKSVVEDSWKELNQEVYTTKLPQDFVQMVVNMARTAQCIFQFGDGIGTSTGVTRDRIVSLFVEDIQ